MNYQLCKEIQNRIIDRFQASYESFLDYIQEEDNPNIIKFVEKYIDWYKDNDLKTFMMFSKVINQDSNYIWDNLRSFCDNYFHDDSFFSVKWYQSEWASGGTKKVPADKEDIHLFPVVEPDDDYGRQDVNLILEAMEQYEKNEAALIQHFIDFGFM
jgi:hypothetical protein